MGLILSNFNCLHCVISLALQLSPPGDLSRECRGPIPLGPMGWGGVRLMCNDPVPPKILLSSPNSIQIKQRRPLLHCIILARLLSALAAILPSLHLLLSSLGTLRPLLMQP